MFLMKCTIKIILEATTKFNLESSDFSFSYSCVPLIINCLPDNFTVIKEAHITMFQEQSEIIYIRIFLHASVSNINLSGQDEAEGPWSIYLIKYVSGI